MTTSGTGIFYDGRTSDRRKVAVEISGDAIAGVPLIADRIAPHLPVALEMRLGAAVDTQVRQALGASTPGKPFECGAGDSPRAAAARAALAKLVAALEAAAELPLPLRTLVVRRADV